MKKHYKKMLSYSFRDYGEHISVSLDDRNTPLFIGCKNTSDMAEACRVLAAEMLKRANQFDHAKDFCAPEYDDAASDEQIEKMKKMEGFLS